MPRRMDDEAARPALSRKLLAARKLKMTEWELEHGEGRNPYSQSAMAAKLGVRTATYSLWETRRPPGASRLRAIAKELDVPAEVFLGEVEPEPSWASHLYGEDYAAELQGFVAALSASLTRLTEIAACIEEQVRILSSAAPPGPAVEAPVKKPRRRSRPRKNDRVNC